MTNDKEIKCYGNQKFVNGSIVALSIFPLIMLIVSITDGDFLRVLPVVASIFAALGLFWYASQKGTFIAVDLDNKTLRASNWFIKTNSIPVNTITHIGTRGMFAGTATEIEITYIKSDGKKRTIGYGTKNFLNPPDLQKILKALVTINPELEMPSELQKTS